MEWVLNLISGFFNCMILKLKKPEILIDEVVNYRYAYSLNEDPI